MLYVNFSNAVVAFCISVCYTYDSNALTTIKKGVYKMHKRIISFIMAALLLASSFTACSENSSENEENETTQEETAVDAAAETETETETEDSRASVEDGLPERDFGGATFTLLTRDDYIDTFMPEELTGEGVNDTLYQRNLKISDRFNVAMQYVSHPCNYGDQATQWNNLLANSVTSGDGAYDLVAGYAATVVNIVSKGIFRNWNEVPYVNMSQPWWSEQIQDAFTVNGKMFYMTGDYSLSLWSNMYAFIFNKEIAENYNIENLYDVVREGKWTLDKLQEISEKCSSDIDGNGVYDENDAYGMTSNWSTAIDTFQISCGMKVLSKTESGSLEFTLNNERSTAVLEKVNKLYHESHGAYAADGDAYFDKIYLDGRALFFPQYFDGTTKLREMDADYGILPYPKFDEEQENYINTSRDNFDLFALTIDVKDVEMSGIITEALAAESYRTVIPQYYDVVLKVKNSRDEDSAEMIDIIRDTLSFDLGYLCSSTLNGAGHFFVNLVRINSSDIASKCASSERSINKLLKKMLEAYGVEE